MSGPITRPNGASIRNTAVGIASLGGVFPDCARGDRHGLLHGRRLPSEHVRLANPAVIEGEHEPGGDVVDVHRGEPDPTERQVAQLSALGEPQLLAELRLVAGPVHRPRLGHDHRRAAAGPFDRQLVSGVLRLVVRR